MSTKRKPVFEVYRRDGLWLWSLKSSNGVEMCEGTCYYQRKRDCLRAVDTVLVAIFDADIRVIE